MCFDYDGYCTIWEERSPKARKPHKCCECGLPIRPGEIYLSVFTVFEGKATTFKLCTGCETYRHAVHEREVEEGCSGGEAWPPLGDMCETLSHGIFRSRWDEDGIHESEPQATKQRKGA